MVDAINHVLQGALAWRGQNNTGDALGFKVLSKSWLIAPATSVVHQDGVLDAIRGVVHGGGVRGVNDLDGLAISNNQILFLINGDGAIEGSVHRVTAQ